MLDGAPRALRADCEAARNARRNCPRSMHAILHGHTLAIRIAGSLLNICRFALIASSAMLRYVAIVTHPRPATTSNDALPYSSRSTSSRGGGGGGGGDRRRRGENSANESAYGEDK